MVNSARRRATRNGRQAQHAAGENYRRGDSPPNGNNGVGNRPRNGRNQHVVGDNGRAVHQRAGYHRGRNAGRDDNQERILHNPGHRVHRGRRGRGGGGKNAGRGNNQERILGHQGGGRGGRFDRRNDGNMRMVENQVAVQHGRFVRRPVNNQVHGPRGRNPPAGAVHCSAGGRRGSSSNLPQVRSTSNLGRGDSNGHRGAFNLGRVGPRLGGGNVPVGLTCRYCPSRYDNQRELQKHMRGRHYNCNNICRRCHKQLKRGEHVSHKCE